MTIPQSEHHRTLSSGPNNTTSGIESRFQSPVLNPSGATGAPLRSGAWKVPSPFPR